MNRILVRKEKLTMRKKPFYTPICIVATVLWIALLGAIVLINPFEFHDHFVEPPILVDDFTLRTSNNGSFRLSDQKGKIVLLFFGYTSCDDVCPTTLATFKEVHDILKDDAQKVRFVMITTDSERDTPDQVAAYVTHFSPDFIGLSGSPSELEKIWEELGAYVQQEEITSSEGYIVSHTASAFVIDQNGILQLLLPYGTSATDLVDNVTRLLNK
jgi:protein SCO1/2